MVYKHHSKNKISWSLSPLFLCFEKLYTLKLPASSHLPGCAIPTSLPTIHFRCYVSVREGSTKSTLSRAGDSFPLFFPWLQKDCEDHVFPYMESDLLVKIPFPLYVKLKISTFFDHWDCRILKQKGLKTPHMGPRKSLGWLWGLTRNSVVSPVFLLGITVGRKKPASTFRKKKKEKKRGKIRSTHQNPHLKSSKIQLLRRHHPPQRLLGRPQQNPDKTGGKEKVLDSQPISFLGTDVTSISGCLETPNFHGDTLPKSKARYCKNANSLAKIWLTEPNHE